MMMLSWVDDLLAGLISVLSETIGAILNIIWILLCQLVYPLVSLLFSLFTSLYSVDIIPKGSETILSGIYGRVTMILTIVMTFYIVFEFVKYTVSPEKITDKEKGAMPLFVRIVIVILLLAFVPTIFSTAKTLQQRVLDTNVIPKVILGTEYIDDDIAGVGREFVGDMFGAFIRVDCENLSLLSCEQLKSGVQASIDSVKEANFFMTAFAVQLDPGIEFSGLLALIFGCFMLYVVFLYCKDIALRHVQLLFLQVCAPIAIISYIAPKKDGMFQKWVKQCLTTYLDLFIRIAILYFIILITKLLGETYQLDELRYAGDGGQISIFVYLFLVTGLLMFLKKVPKLLEELFPKSGAASIGFGFSAKDRQGILGSPLQVAARTAGTIAGAVRAGKAIKDGSLLSDKEKTDTGKWAKLRRGATYANAMARAGYKGFQSGKDGNIGAARKAGLKKVEEYENVVANKGTVLGHDFGSGKAQTIQAEYKLKIEGKEQQIKINDDFSSMIKSAKSAQDAGEDRATKKLAAREQMIKIENAEDVEKLKKNIKTQTADLSKYGINITEGQTTSDIYSILEAKANSAKSTATAFNQELVRAETEATASKSKLEKQKAELNKLLIAATNANDVETITSLNKQIAENNATYAAYDDQIAALKTLVEEKEAEEVEIKTLAEKALKELSRYAFTRAMRGNIDANNGEKIDAVLSSNIATVKQVLENLRVSAIESTEEAAKLQEALSAELYEKVMHYEDKVKTFEDFDDIQGALTNYASRLSDENSAIKEEIRRIKDEKEYQESKANLDGQN